MARKCANFTIRSQRPCGRDGFVARLAFLRGGWAGSCRLSTQLRFPRNFLSAICVPYLQDSQFVLYANIRVVPGVTKGRKECSKLFRLYAEDFNISRSRQRDSVAEKLALDAMKEIHVAVEPANWTTYSAVITLGARQSSKF